MSCPSCLRAALAACALLVVPAGAGDEPSALLQRLASSTSADRSGLAREFGRSGPDGLGVLFDVLASGRVAFLDPDGAPKERALDDASRDVLFEAFRLASRAWVDEVLEARSTADAEARLTVLEILQRQGTLSDVRLLARCATPPAEGREPRQANLEAALRSALAGILERHEGGLAALRALLGEVHDDLHDDVYAALGDCGSKHAFELLATLVETDSEHERLLLLHLGRAAAHQPRPVAADVRRLVRRHLAAGPDTTITREAALAAGRLSDDDAVERLVELLGHDERGVVDAAHWALKAITGLAYEAHANRWQAWFESEQAWWKSSASETLEALRTGSRPLLARAVNEVGSHRWRRAQLAEALAAALPRSIGASSLSICSQLAQLGVPESVPALVDALGRAEGDVRAAAHRALRELTGLDLPPDAGLWRARTASH